LAWSYFRKDQSEQYLHVEEWFLQNLLWTKRKGIPETPPWKKAVFSLP